MSTGLGGSVPPIQVALELVRQQAWLFAHVRTTSPEHDYGLLRLPELVLLLEALADEAEGDLDLVGERPPA